MTSRNTNKMCIITISKCERSREKWVKRQYYYNYNYTLVLYLGIYNNNTDNNNLIGNVYVYKFCNLACCVCPFCESIDFHRVNNLHKDLTQHNCFFFVHQTNLNIILYIISRCDLLYRGNRGYRIILWKKSNLTYFFVFFFV